jgi:hypothetical protein
MSPDSTLTGVANLVSGRFAMIESGLGFQLVPWHQVLEGALASTSPDINAMTTAPSEPSEELGGSASSTESQGVGTRQAKAANGAQPTDQEASTGYRRLISPVAPAAPHQKGHL